MNKIKKQVAEKNQEHCAQARWILNKFHFTIGHYRHTYKYPKYATRIKLAYIQIRNWIIT